ncbi:hypothetical protein [Nocardiopsis potens]|uniref:hypothetical protein n=1 Tax=Nocardiopsis potens TaxID=1246458 RepID=UPI000366B1FA|nr:hypothetical protein [Nocardiopsis potens]
MTCDGRTRGFFMCRWSPHALVGLGDQFFEHAATRVQLIGARYFAEPSVGSGGGRGRPVWSRPPTVVGRCSSTR